jgi:hypothetical protein
MASPKPKIFSDSDDYFKLIGVKTSEVLNIAPENRVLMRIINMIVDLKFSMSLHWQQWVNIKREST